MLIIDLQYFKYNNLIIRHIGNIGTSTDIQ